MSRVHEVALADHRIDEIQLRIKEQKARLQARSSGASPVSLTMTSSAGCTSIWKSCNKVAVQKRLSAARAPEAET